MKFEPVLKVAGPKDAVEPVLMLPLVPVRKETGTKGKIVVHPMARFLLVIQLMTVYAKVAFISGKQLRFLHQGENAFPFAVALCFF